MPPFIKAYPIVSPYNQPPIPTGWDDQGMDWSNPNPFEAKYWRALVAALHERMLAIRLFYKYTTGRTPNTMENVFENMVSAYGRNNRPSGGYYPQQMSLYDVLFQDGFLLTITFISKLDDLFAAIGGWWGNGGTFIEYPRVYPWWADAPIITTPPTSMFFGGYLNSSNPLANYDLNLTPDLLLPPELLPWVLAQELPGDTGPKLKLYLKQRKFMMDKLLFVRMSTSFPNYKRTRYWKSGYAFWGPGVGYTYHSESEAKGAALAEFASTAWVEGWNNQYSSPFYRTYLSASGFDSDPSGSLQVFSMYWKVTFHNYWFSQVLIDLVLGIGYPKEYYNVDEPGFDGTVVGYEGWDCFASQRTPPVAQQPLFPAPTSNILLEINETKELIIGNPDAVPPWPTEVVWNEDHTAYSAIRGCNFVLDHIVAKFDSGFSFRPST